jgi:hypothetical protein
MKMEINQIACKGLERRGLEREKKVRTTKPRVENPEKVMKRHQDNMNIQRILNEKKKEVKKIHNEMQVARTQRCKQINERLRKEKLPEPVVSLERQIEIAKEIDEKIKQRQYG